MSAKVMKFEVKPQFVSESFINRLRNQQPPVNAISEFTFYRTYSRYEEALKRRETWLEAVVRSSEYSISLAIEQLQRVGLYEKEIHLPMFIEEAEELIEAQYMLETFVSGRTLYTGGSIASRLYPLSNFNCSGAVMDSLKKFGELFYLLMVGTGFGFRVTKEDVAKLPAIRQDIEIEHKPYEPRPKHMRYEESVLRSSGETATLHIGDSKEGWRQSIDFFFELLTKKVYSNVKKLVIIYDSIREKGSRLKTFGGTASGWTSMHNMFVTIDKVIHDQLDERIAPIKEGKLRPIHVMDISNAIAYNVVSGGVRRSAQVCLFDHDDKEVLFAKYGLNGLYGHKAKEGYDKLKKMSNDVPEMEFIFDENVVDEEGNQIPFVPGRYHLEHRRMSNNSALYFKKPSRKQLKLIVSLLKFEGEPGFINGEEALRRFPWFKTVNPCVEILLDDRGLCNLSTIPAINHVKDGKLDKESLLKAARISARIGVRMTTIDLELPEWDEIQKKHRLTGCSLTGWQDMKEAVGMTDEEENVLLEELRAVTKAESYRYADFLMVPRPKNVTAVKPEGTQSLLAGGVSSGLHAAHSPYYIRRIRVSATDPLAMAMESMGFKLENEVGQGITYTDPATGEVVTTAVSTKVASFYIKSPSKRTKDDLTVEEQFDTYFRFQKHYTDQNTSNTITVKPHEWDTVEEILWNRWDEMLAVSFLSLDGGTYQLAPLESITEKQYNEFSENLPVFDPEVLERFDTREDFDLEDAAACEGGACPIR
ncbi:ribonucleoside-triphosphate reductase, adenosylcobalamin-dependent [Cytobacillus oceanisediminis]|uniref:ribonucleoside-triphosphate reductase, adenosylcobalamin-dependent n=1 Tax=Cytobacillus oceanisediminis TaxID=665099 RepID=UPI001FB2506C|nr:ribonucleoside-triphosphate reductase, adenosylcobalamin-dependent [Cytobacillus oceanisediminis]UOE58018.1 ribonucleoside-triphosphate reductase, adenosylcobalamin-dependent [Cytobacillus oceanisediminis]